MASVVDKIGEDIEIVWACENEMCGCLSEEVWGVGYSGDKKKQSWSKEVFEKCD